MKVPGKAKIVMNEFMKFSQMQFDVKFSETV